MRPVRAPSRRHEQHFAELIEVPPRDARISAVYFARFSPTLALSRFSRRKLAANSDARTARAALGRPPRPDGAVAMRVAFVYYRYLDSTRVRGEDPAAHLHQTFSACDKLEGRFDVVVHLKVVCERAFAMANHHVFDHIDARQDRLAVFRRQSHRFDGQIFNSNKHMEHECVRPYCTVIPHPYNFPCASRVSRARLKPLVGLIGYSKPPPGDLTTLRRTWNVSVIREPSSFDSACPFFDRLTMAVAWNKGQPDNQPAERFTSPVVLGIPTVGYLQQASMAEYGDEFLCGSVECITEMVRRVHAGEMHRRFSAFRRDVLRDVTWNATKERYEALFREVRALPALGRGGATPHPRRVQHVFARRNASVRSVPIADDSRAMGMHVARGRLQQSLLQGKVSSRAKPRPV